MEPLYSSGPWYLTVIRTQGILFLRPEKSWRPIVSVSVDGNSPQEVVLGCDGQNPNLKTPFVLRDVDCNSRIDIKVHHKSHSKNRKKRRLVGEAYVVVKDILRRQERAESGEYGTGPGSHLTQPLDINHAYDVDIDLRLNCPPPQKRSPTIGGARQSKSAMLTVRLRPPPEQPPQPSSSSITAVSSAPTSDHEGGIFSDDVLSDAAPISRTSSSPRIDELGEPNQEGTENTLRRRRKSKPKLKPYSLDSDEEACSSSSSSSAYPPSPSSNAWQDFTHNIHIHEGFDDDDSQLTLVASPRQKEEEGYFAPRILPMSTGQGCADDRLSFGEAFLDRFAPYRELKYADSPADYERILGKLLTEWYVVGASLLAIAALNATIFGFFSDSLFSVDGLAKRAVAFGSIASGIGIVSDAWFLVAYSGADAAKFKRLALDVYNSYFFFSLTCRLPTLCLFAGACSLMVFLLTIAWEAWPSAVLVMSFMAGILVSLQYLVFGIHRICNLMIWTCQRVWRGSVGLFRGRRGTVEPVAASGVNGDQAMAPSAVSAGYDAT
ncbi:hypothetical protein K474DRAFT_1707316 [Panus rudis PR-1116 ss-1]|nr:hypothetical protein K474DRAFT_1707316 [Panus rudis PR-1116 ss-1]